MFERFSDYMYYLLTAPFKKVRQEINQWYILFKVLGKKFDEGKEALFKSRDESMVATCSEAMLSEHGRDRGLTRYAGEEIENYRRRIALYEEVCRLGGSNEGIILAAKTLGYYDVSVISAKEYKQDSERWAEFYVLLRLDMDEEHPIEFGILRKSVRSIKEVGAKDNYGTVWKTECKAKNTIQSRTGVVAKLENVLKESSAILLRGQMENKTDLSGKVILNWDYWYFDGEYSFADERHFGSQSSREEELI